MSLAKRYSDLHRGKTFEAFFFHGLNFRAILFTIKQKTWTMM